MIPLTGRTTGMAGSRLLTTASVVLLSVLGAPLAAQEEAAASPLDFGLSATGFGEAPVAGAGDNSLAPGGKVVLTFALDGGAAGIFPGFFVNGIIEQNLGEDVNTRGDGTILPVNTALAFPTSGGSDFALSLTVTQLIGESASVTFGKFDMVAAAAAIPLIGGGGSDTFQNIGLAAPPGGGHAAVCRRRPRRVQLRASSRWRGAPAPPASAESIVWTWRSPK
jgi:hypothetical protein